MQENKTEIRLYVHEHEDGTRQLTGGGAAEDGSRGDIHGTIAPGETWHGYRYEDLEPGRYTMIGDRFVRDEPGK